MSSSISHPGSGYNYVICDICGKKLRSKDAHLVTAKYSPFKGCLVCANCVDEKNDKDRPYIPRVEKPLNPTFIRSEPADQYVVNENSDRLASKPRNLIVTLDPIEDYIQLTWDGASDPGSGMIIGYQITRANPQLSYESIVEDNTNSAATYYLDTTADIDEEYTYTVRAITDVGDGAISDYGYYPNQKVSSSIVYIYDGNGLVIQDGNSEYLLDEESA